MGDDDAVRGPLRPSASRYLDSQPVRPLQDVHLPYAATFSLRENVQKFLQFGFGTPREGWEGTGGSYLAPCCPSPHTCIAQAILVFLLRVMLAVVQAKEAERRRQHRAGSARRRFLAGMFAAFLSSQCPDPSRSNQQPQTPSPKLKDELCRAAEEQDVVQGRP